MDENNNNGEYGYEGTPNSNPVDAGTTNNVEYTAVPNNEQTNVEDGTKHPINIAALVCGILGIVGICIPYVSNVAWLLAIVGIVLGVIGRKYPGAKLGKAGMICGIVGLSLLLLVVIATVVLGVAAFSMLGSSLGSM
ncbi:MAG: hypothetical protein IKI57_05535 [Clostridia bacterium]|nr:hypothetical protein [Clostridia bacterium]